MPGFSQQLSDTLRVRVWGERACFTRARDEGRARLLRRDDASAARGVLEASPVEAADALDRRAYRRFEAGPQGLGPPQRGWPESLGRQPHGAMAGRSVGLGIDIEEARQQRAA